MEDNSAAIGKITLLKPRQKNCNSCVQAKRRCDRQSPICSRCAKKNLLCRYGGVEATSLSSVSSRRLSFGSIPCSLFVPDSSLNLEHLDITALDSQLDCTVPGLDSIQDFVMDDLTDGNYPTVPVHNSMGSDVATMQGRWLVQGDCSSSTDEQITKAYKKMSPLCVGLAVS